MPKSTQRSGFSTTFPRNHGITGHTIFTKTENRNRGLTKNRKPKRGQPSDRCNRIQVPKSFKRLVLQSCCKSQYENIYYMQYNRNEMKWLKLYRGSQDSFYASKDASDSDEESAKSSTPAITPLLSTLFADSKTCM